MALEGKEVEGVFAKDGKYEVDVTDKGIVEAKAIYMVQGVEIAVTMKVDVIDILKMLAAKTSNTLDDAAIAMIASALGR